MKLDMYQIDAFASRLFQGNPAAVIPLDNWLSEEVLQAIAEENNLSETVYFVPLGSGFHIRWFTPNNEVKLCGHATLASAWVLFNELEFQGNKIQFESLSGPLHVIRLNDGRLQLDFPDNKPMKSSEPEKALVEKALGVPLLDLLADDDYLAIVESQQILEKTQPDMGLLKQLDNRGVIVSSVGESHDFVVRFFAPSMAIDEDPVTGSAYTQAGPYWAEKLARTKMTAKQLSQRTGEIDIEVREGRVYITGSAVKFMQAVVELPDAAAST